LSQRSNLDFITGALGFRARRARTKEKEAIAINEVDNWIVKDLLNVDHLICKCGL
jgi:hypothetical protein